jgi:hypothetical protein
VEAIFVGKARQCNRRFLQMRSHRLIEPVACTPASGWEKGQVENQVGNLRDQMFRPKPRVKSLAELNACFNFTLQGVYVAGVVGSLVRFWLSVRGARTSTLASVGYMVDQ